MDMMEIRRQMMGVIAMSAASKDPVYYTKYELTGDTKIKALLDEKQYHVHYDKFLILIRANGTVAPQTGNYTMNNYLLVQNGNNRVYARHSYKNGHTPPNDFQMLITKEANNYLSVQNGVLTYTDSTSTSCLGTTGDNVVITEIPFDSDKYLGND